MRVLSLDLSTKSGWALFEDSKLIESGALSKVEIINFNVNKDPNKCPEYPQNIMAAAEGIALMVNWLVVEKKPDHIVIENSVKGKNRHTQRLIEWMHFCIVKLLKITPFTYLDPSEWRSIVGLRLDKEQKKNNRDVSSGKKRGKITRKHLSVNMVNEKYGLKLKLKDNDQADAILLGLAYCSIK